MGIFNIILGLALVNLVTSQNVEANAATNEIMSSPKQQRIVFNVDKTGNMDVFGSDQSYSQDYYNILNKHRISWILRKNLINFIGSLLNGSLGSLAMEIVASLFKIHQGMRERQLSTLEMLPILPDIAYAPHNQQLLALLKRLEGRSPVYLNSHVVVVIGALSSNTLDVEAVLENLKRTTTPHIFNEINKESLTDLKIDTKWPENVQTSVNRTIESLLGNLFACTMSALALGHLKPTNKLMTYLIMNLPLDRYDSEVNEALHYIYDTTRKTLVVPEMTPRDGIYNDPYVMAQRFLKLLANNNENAFIAESAKIVLRHLKSPTGRPESAKSDVVQFKNSRLVIDFDRLFDDVITSSEFPEDVFYAKKAILKDVVHNKRYNIEDVFKEAPFYYAEDDMDMLVIVLDKFMRRLPLPEDVLDNVKLVRAHLLLLQRYRKNYNIGDGSIVRGLSDVSLYLDTFCSKDPVKNVSKYLKEQLYWLPVNWYSALKLLPQMRLARQTAGTALKIISYKKLIPDKRVDLVVQQFLESKFKEMNWTMINAPNADSYTGRIVRPYVRPNFEIKFADNFTSKKFQKFKPNSLKEIVVTIVDSKLNIDTQDVCVDKIRLKPTNPDVQKNIKDLIEELPDINNPQMFWSVKTFFLFNYKDIFNSNLNVCSYPNHRLLLIGAISKVLSMQQVREDPDLKSALTTYLSALNSGANRIDLPSVLYFLQEPALKTVLPNDVSTLPQDLESLRPLLRKTYAIALQKKFEAIDFERFKKLEDIYKQYNKNYDLGDFSLSTFDEINKDSNKDNLEILRSTLKPENLLTLLGPDFDKSLSKTPKQLLRSIINNILRNNVGTLKKPTEEALRYFLNTLGEVPSIIKLENIPEIPQNDKYLPELNNILRWDHLRPFLQMDFAYPDRSTNLDQLKYIIDYVLRTNPDKIGPKWLSVLKHFQQVLNSTEPLPIINVSAIPGLDGTPEQVNILNKVLLIHNLIKFLPPDFHYQDSTSPKSQLKNIIENLLYFSKTKLKKSTVEVLTYFNDQLSNPTSDEIIDVSQIKEINPNDEMLNTIREVLRKETIYKYIPPNFRFDASVTPKEQLLKILKSIVNVNGISVVPKWREAISHFMKVLDTDVDVDIPVLPLDEINEICVEDKLLPTLREILKPKRLWKLVDINYKTKANSSPKAQLKSIIDNTLNVSVEKLSKVEFDALNHFQDILDYADECRYLPPVVNVTYVPQINQLDEHVPVLYDILRIDILVKLISRDFQFDVFAEQQHLLKEIIENILNNSGYKLKPKWLSVLYYFKMQLITSVNVVANLPELKRKPELNVVINILKTVNVTSLDVDTHIFGNSRKRVVKILNIVKKRVTYLDGRTTGALDKLLAAVNDTGNGTSRGVVNIDDIDSVYVTNPNYEALHFLIHKPDLVNSLSPNFESFKDLKPKEQLLFFSRDVMSTNSTKLTPEMRDTISYYYNLLTESVDKLEVNVFKPKEIENVLSKIQSIQSDKLLVGLKMILLNPNLIHISKPSSLYDQDKPHQILLYIMNMISITYPDLEMVKETKEIFDHFRGILAQPSPVTSEEYHQPITPPSTTVVQQDYEDLNATAFVIEFDIYLRSIAKSPEKDMLLTILHTPNSFDLLELQLSQMYKNSPKKNVGYILNGIRNHLQEVKVLVPTAQLDALNYLFKKFPEQGEATKPTAVMAESIARAKIPNRVQQEIKNVINVFVDVPGKELITVALNLENAVTLLNISLDTMLHYRPDQKLYYFVQKLHENYNKVSRYFPQENLRNVVRNVISNFNTGQEFAITHNGEKTPEKADNYIPKAEEVMTKLKEIVKGPERELVDEVFRKPDIGKLLHLDSLIMSSNTPEENLIYVLHKVKELGKQANVYFPGKDVAGAVLSILSYNKGLSTRTPYESTTPMTLTFSVVKEKISESIKYLYRNYDSDNQDLLISILKTPGLGSLLGLNKTVLEQNNPKDNVMYIFDKVNDNIDKISTLYPNREIRKAVISFTKSDVNSTDKTGISRPLLVLIEQEITKYHQNQRNFGTLMLLANLPNIEKTIHLNRSMMASKSPLENMITIFQKVKENIGDVSTLLPKEEIESAVAVVLKEDKQSSLSTLSAIKEQIEIFYAQKPEKKLLMQITNIPDIENKIHVNVPVMMYRSPLENMLDLFQSVKREINQGSSLITDKTMLNALSFVLKEDGKPVSAVLTPIKQQIELYYTNVPQKELMLQMIEVASKSNITSLNVPLMKYKSPLENMIYFFQKVKENMSQFASLLPGQDVQNAVETILKTDEHFLEISLRQITRQIEYFYDKEPKKEFLIQMLKLKDAENEIHINVPLMKYNSPKVNMIYFFQRVKDEVDKVSTMFPGNDIKSLLKTVLKEDGDNFGELLIPIRQKIESIFGNHPMKELWIKMTKVKDIENVISINVPVMRYNSPLQNMIYFFERIKEDTTKVSEMFSGDNIQDALSIVLQKDGIVPAVLVFSISKQIDIFHKNQPNYGVLLDITSIPGIEYVINLDIPLMNYYSPLENMIYFFERAKDNIDQLSAMYPRKNFQQAIQVVLKEEEKPWSTLVGAIRKQIEFLDISKADKNLLVEITKNPRIEKEINVNIPLMKYKPTLENMIYFFEMVKDGIKKVSTVVPNQDISKVVQRVLGANKTVTFFKPISQQIETLFKEDSNKNLMIQISKIPNIIDMLNINLPLMKYNPPLSNLIYFFQKVKENVEKISAILPNEDIRGVIETILKEDDKPMSTLLIPIVEQITSFFGDLPLKELMIQLPKIPDIEHKIYIDYVFMKYNSPFENMIYFFQKVKENIDWIDFALLPIGDVKKAIQVILKEDVKPILFSKIISGQVEILYANHPLKGIMNQIISIPNIEQQIYVNVPITRYQSALENMIYFFKCVRENIAKVSESVPETKIKDAIAVVLKENEEALETYFTIPILRQVELYYGNHPEKETLIQILNNKNIINAINLNRPLMRYNSELENLVYFFQKTKENIDKIEKWLPGKDVKKVVTIVLKDDQNKMETLLPPILRQVERYFGRHPDKKSLTQILMIPNIEKIIHLNVPVMKYKSPLENLLYFYRNLRDNVEEISVYVPEMLAKQTLGLSILEQSHPQTNPRGALLVEILQQITKYFNRQPEMEILKEIVKTPKIDVMISLDFPLTAYYPALEKMVYFFEKVQENIEKATMVLPGVNVPGVLSVVLKEDGTKAASVVASVVHSVETKFDNHTAKELLIQITKIPNIENIININVHVMKYRSPMENMVYFYQKVEDSVEKISEYLPGSGVRKVIDFVLRKDNQPLTTIISPIIQQINTFFKKQPVKEVLISILKLKDIDRLLMLNLPLMKYNSPLMNMIYFFENVKDNLNKLSGIFPEENINSALSAVLKEGENYYEYVLTPIIQQVGRMYRHQPQKELLIKILKIPNIETKIYLELALMKYNSPIENVIYFFQKVKDNIKTVSLMLPGEDIHTAVTTVFKYDGQPMETVVSPIIDQLSTLNIAKPLKKLLIQIAKSPYIHNTLNLNTNLMRYNAPFENMIYLYQAVRDNVEKISGIFPGKDIEKGVATVLRDNVGLLSLKATIAEKISALFSNRPEKNALIQITKINDIENKIHLTIPIMSYKSPLENMIYFFERVQDNVLAVSSLLPGTDVNSVLQIVLDDSNEQLSIAHAKILQQIEAKFNGHPSKELLIQILKIPDIEQEIHISVSLMKFLSPLETMIYIFKQIKYDIIKVATYFPVPDIQKAVSIVLKEDEKNIRQTILAPIINAIKSFYDKQPDMKSLTKIVNAPGIEEIIRLDIPIMKYYTPLENMIYFFQKVEENIGEVSAVVPDVDIKNLVATILKKKGKPFGALIKPILELIEDISVTTPSKNVLVQILNIPDVENIININVALMQYNSRFQNMVYIFQKVKENIGEISKSFPGTDVQNVIGGFLDFAVKNITSVYSDESAMTTEILLPLIQQVEKYYYNTPEKPYLMQIFKIKRIEIKLNLNITAMNYSTPLENMIYFFEKVNDNIEKISAFVPGLDLKKTVSNILKQDVNGGSSKTRVEQISSLTRQIQKYYDKRPVMEVLASITKLRNIVDLLKLNIPLMTYQSPLENLIYFFQKVKNNILEVSKLLPGKDVAGAVSYVLNKDTNPFKQSSVLHDILETQILKYYPKEIENELLFKILKIPGIEDKIHINIPVMKYNPPLENMITFFQNVKDNIVIVSKYLPGDDVNKAVAMVLKEDLSEKLFGKNKTNYIVSQIIQQIEEYVYTSSEKNVLIQIVKMPNVGDELSLNKALMMYNSPLENMLYFFDKVKDSIPKVSEYLGGKDILQTISRVLDDDTNTVSVSVGLNKNPLLSVSQIVDELYFSHPDKGIIQQIINHKDIEQYMNLNIPLMKYLSPLEKLIYFFQQVQDNIASVSTLMPKVDVKQAVVIVLRGDIHDTRNIINKIQTVKTPIIQQISKYFNTHPSKELMLQMIKMPGIESTLNLNIPLMTYHSPMENLVYFFQKVKDNIAKLSLLLPGSGVENAVSVVLREKEAAHKTECVIPIVSGQIEKNNVANSSKELLIKILRIPNIINAIHLSVPLMIYNSPLENYIYFFAKVKGDANNLLKHVTRREVNDALNLVLSRGNASVTFHEPIHAMFPIEQQIEKYVTNPSEKEMLIEILHIPDIEQKIYLNIPLMMYNSPLENMIYIFSNVADNVQKVAAYFPGREIQKALEHLLNRDVKSPYAVPEKEKIPVFSPIVNQISNYVTKRDDRETLIKVLNTTDIEHLINIAVPLMQYQTPLENMIYFLQKIQDKIEKISAIIQNNNLKRIVSMILINEPISSVVKQIENTIEYYFKESIYKQIFIKIVKITDVIPLLHLNPSLMKYQSPLQNMIYFLDALSNDMAKVSTIIPNNELREALQVVLKNDEPIGVTISAIQAQIETFYPNVSKKELLIQITKIPNIEQVLNLNIPLMKYSSPVENMVYLFQAIKDDVQKMSAILPSSEVQRALQLVINGNKYLSTTLMRPIFKQIEILFYKDKLVRDMFVQITKVPGIEGKLTLNAPLLKFLSPLESLIYFSQKIKDNIGELSKLVSRVDLPKVLGLVLKEDEIAESRLLTPVIEQVEVFYRNKPDKETIIQITNLPDVKNQLILNVPLMKYFPPLEKFIYFFQKVKENVDKVSTILPGKNIRSVVTTLLRDDKNISITLYLPVKKQIQMFYKQRNIIKNVLLEIIKVPEIGRVLSLNIPMMKYNSPLENMIYFCQMVKNNIEEFTTIVPEKDLKEAMSIVLKIDGKPSTILLLQIGKQIEEIYYKQPQKEIMIEICKIPDIEHVINLNIPLMKYKSPLENMVYFFQKIKENMDKTSTVLPGRDIKKAVSIILQESGPSLVSMVATIVHKIQAIYDDHPDKEKLIQSTQIPDIEFLIHLDIPLMRYSSPLENLIYVFQNIDYNQDTLSAIFPGSYLKEAVAIILKRNEAPLGTLLLSIRNEINLFFRKLPEKDLLLEMTKLPDLEQILNINLPLMRYNSILENMIYFFQKVNDQKDKISEFFPGKNLSSAIAVVLRDDKSSPGTVITPVVQQIEFWCGQLPDKNMLIQVSQIPDIEHAIHLNIPLMKYQSPLENMIYFFKNINDNIGTLTTIIPQLDFRKAVAIILKEGVQTTMRGRPKKPGEILSPVVYQIERYFKTPEKKILIQVMKSPKIEESVDFNIPLMRYNSPLENMVYFFSRVKENVANLSSLLPNVDINKAVSVVLKESDKQLEIILGQVRKEIITYYDKYPEKDLLLEITKIPRVENMIFLNIPVMSYNSPLVNMIYFYQNVQHNIDKVSIVLPGKNIKDAVAIALKANGTSLSILLLPLIRHVEQFYSKRPDKDIFIKILRMSDMDLETFRRIKVYIPIMRYNTDVENLIYFFENVRDNSYEFSELFPNNNADKAITNFLSEAAKYVAEKKTPVVPSETRFSRFIPQIIQQIDIYIPQRSERELLSQLAMLPAITQLFSDADYNTLGKNTPVNNLKFFLQKVSKNTNNLSKLIPDKNLNLIIQVALDKVNRENPATLTTITLTTTEAPYSHVSRIPDQKLLLETVDTIIPGNEKEWIMSVLNLPNIVDILHLNMSFMTSHTPIDNLKYILAKAKENLEPLQIYFPGKNLASVISKAINAVESPSAVAPITSTTTESTVATTTPSPLYSELPRYLEDVASAVPKNVSLTSLRVFTTLLRTHNFLSILNIPFNVLRCYTPKKLLDVIIDSVLKSPDIISDYVVQNAIYDIARNLGMRVSNGEITTSPSFNISDIMALLPKEVAPAEVNMLKDFLNKPNLFEILNINHDMNAFMFQYPTPFKRLKMLLYRAANSLNVTEKLKKSIVKILDLLIKFTAMEQDKNTSLKITLSLPETVNAKDIATVVAFLKRKHLLQDMGLSMERTDFASDNDFGYAVLNACKLVPSVANDTPLYNSIVSVIEGLKEAECFISPQKCQRNVLFQKLQQSLDLNDTTIQVLKDILNECHVMETLNNDVGKTAFVQILLNVYNSDVVRRVVKYKIIVRNILIKLGVSPDNQNTIDVKVLISRIPTTTKHYTQLIKFLNVFDVNRIIGPSISPSSYNSPTELLVAIVEALLAQVVHPENTVLYESLNDVLLNLKPQADVDYDVLIRQLIEYLPNAESRWVVQDLLTKHNVLKILGNDFDIKIYNGPKSKLTHLLKKVSKLDIVIENTLLMTSIKMCIILLENDIVEESPEDEETVDFVKLMQLFDKSKHGEYYEILRIFLSRRDLKVRLGPTFKVRVFTSAKVMLRVILELSIQRELYVNDLRLRDTLKYFLDVLKFSRTDFNISQEFFTVKTVKLTQTVDLNEVFSALDINKAKNNVGTLNAIKDVFDFFKPGSGFSPNVHLKGFDVTRYSTTNGIFLNAFFKHLQSMSDDAVPPKLKANIAKVFPLITYTGAGAIPVDTQDETDISGLDHSQRKVETVVM